MHYTTYQALIDLKGGTNKIVIHVFCKIQKMDSVGFESNRLV